MNKTLTKPVFVLTAVVIFLITGCMNRDHGQAPLPENYLDSLQEWKDNRVNVLKGPVNWLRLDGIYWLEEGENSFGSGSDQDLVFPEGTIPHHAGIMIQEYGIITMRVAEGVTILHNDEPVSEMIIFDGENRPRIIHEQLEWFIDSRGNDHGVRLYNKDNPKADAFDGFPSYPVKPEWHLKARFTANTDSISITLDNVIGEEVERFSPGNVEFFAEGNHYSLIAFEANSGLFIIFADHTNQTETYHAGRYMIISFPDEDGNTIIDFNKAYNPPCAFNTFTTCQLPPPRNRLDIAIPAGEKRPVDWDGI
jgi:uncharacterized protein (DUF1684 family)